MNNIKPRLQSEVVPTDFFLMSSWVDSNIVFFFFKKRANWLIQLSLFND